MLLSSDTPAGLAKSMGLGLIGFGDAFQKLHPDLILVLGDRFEIFSAVSAAMVANFYTQGEVCTHGTRVFVHEGIYDEFVAQLKKRTELLVVGDPLDEQTQIVALISKEHES